MSTGIYPAIGLQLALASSNPQEPVWASMGTATYVIPDGSYSVGVPLNGGMTTSLNVLYGTAPSGTAFEVRYSITPDFADEYVLDSVLASGSNKTYTWSTADMVELDGFIRVKNTGGQNITKLYVQQRAAFNN